MTRKKIHAFVGAVALALALNGCGGSGTTESEPPMPTPKEMAAGNLSTATAAQAALPPGASDTMQRDAAQAVATAAAAYLALLQADPGASHSEVARVQGLLAAANMTVTEMQAAIDHANTLSTHRGNLATAQMNLDNATDASGRLDAANAVIMAADAYLAVLTADPTTPHTEITRVQTARQSARTARDMAQMDIDDAESERMAAETLANARTALTQAKATFATVDAAAASSAQDRVDAANAVLAAAQALAALDPSAQSEVDAAQGAVNMAQAVRNEEIAGDMAAEARATARDALADARTAAARVNGSATATNEDRRNAAQEVVNKAMELHALLESQDRPVSEVNAAADELTAARNDLMMAQAQVDADVAAAAREMALATAMTRLADAQQAVMDLPEDATEAQQQVALKEQLDAANAVKEMLDPDTTPATVYNKAEDDVMMAKTAFDAIEMAIANRATAVMEATTALETARTAVMALTDESTDAERLAAQAALRDAAMALNEARETPDADVAAEYEAAKMAAAELETKIATDAAAAKVVADTAAAATKRTAIAAEAAQTNDAGLGGSDVTATGNDEGAYNIDIKRARGAAAVVTVTVEGDTDANDEDFALAMDLGGGTSMHTRTMDANDDDEVVQEVAFVSTDIEGPKATAFRTVHPPDIRVDGETATDTMPNDALNVVDANLAHVKASAFTAPTGTVGTTILSFQHEVADDDGTPEDEARKAAEIMGTYEGAMGTYKCNADSACTVTVNGMGVVSGVSNANDWIFIPASDAMVDVADTDYLHYGFWLQKTTDEDGVVTYDEVETFAGSNVDQSTGLGSVTGKASYSGGANGVFVREVYKSTDGSVETATSGHFTADASLTAYFAQTEDDADTLNVNEAGQIPPAMLNSLSGTINNFELSSGEANDWSVALTAAANTITAGGSATGATNGGGTAGTYSATFHGDTADDTQPHSVVGEFNANFGNGTVAGAFGARKDD